MKILRYASILSLFSCALHAGPKSHGALGSELDFLDFGRVTVAPFSYSASSSYHEEYGAYNLFDGDPKTYWYSSAEPKPEWIIVDFGSKRLMNAVEIIVPIFRGKRAVSEYEIQVLQQENWKTIFRNDRVDHINFHNLPPLDASILRLYFPKTEDKSLVLGGFKILLNGIYLNSIPDRFSGYLYPVPDGLLPDKDYQLPGAPREYRNGIHKGLDIYYKKEKFGPPRRLTFQDGLVSPADGIVIRADLDYSPMTLADFQKYSALAQKNGVTYVEKDFGGRQVWIDHGNGIMSSFNHLSSIQKGIRVGSKVKAGEEIGKAGNSGLVGEAKGTDENIHLHYEIWVDGEYLGAGIPTNQMRKLLQYFFSKSNLN
ncbi:M23 family peptidase [Leptospira wolffii]|uniref:M23 family metallopeptidase n=1 Tax=Leptospira wolffii TaxID=409998 RepID=UPI001082F1D5|nr:M23 family metallopeptidase [Leptospira wolffii]TGK60100.1 M23 family peptidase [Leptospira wolffii]TGK72443.1 M23 family peptidase [Leptospira wolffii]TGK76107.1 M23 family peptidase [Leptospira wolffii]TGL30359.1 M23 family peptidase [Leptospira wolffii]